MKTKNKLLTALLLCAGATTSIALINQGLKVSSTSRNLLSREDSHTFNWRLGSVYYTKKGSGKPLLMIHNLNALANGEEYSRLTGFLTDRFCVYTLDLPGCGRSEKTAVTYTAYFYVQLISDFIHSVIGRRTSVIASGESAGIVFGACKNDPDLFEGILIVNPESITDSCLIPSEIARLYKHLIDLPVLGTLIYNIAVSKKMIAESLIREGFFNHALITPAFIDSLSESAHLGSCPKALFSSVRCNYTKCSLENAVKKIDNSIVLVGGGALNGMAETLAQYKAANPAIETFLIPKAKGLLQMEAPYELGKIIKTCL